MKIYKANKYHTTMNDYVIIVLGTDRKKLKMVDELFKNCIYGSNDNEESWDIFNAYIKENNLIYLDDVNEPLKMGRIDFAHEVVIDNDKAYVYEIIRYYSGRF